MNERIRELYRQAQVPHTAIDPSNNMPYETTTFSANKFAELIVQSCIETAERYGTPDAFRIADEIKRVMLSTQGDRSPGGA